MLLFLISFITVSRADTCPLQNRLIDQPKLVRYAEGSRNLIRPKLFRTEESPEFGADYPTTFWALATDGSTVEVKVRRAVPLPSADGAIQITWTDTVLTIDPAAKTVSGADDCDGLNPVAEHVLEILNVIQEPGAPK